nr:G protein-coupled receptor [Proales similis]
MSSGNSTRIVDTVGVFTTRLTDTFNVFVFPPIILTGIILNALNMLILYRMGISSLINKLMVLNSFCDLAFLIFSVFIALFRCGVYCPLAYKFESKVYEQYIYLFVGNTFLLVNSLIDVYLTLNRLGSFAARSRLKNWFSEKSMRGKVLFMFVIALLMNTPSYLITRNVKLFAYLNQGDGTLEPLYRSSSNSLGDNDVVTILLFILTLLRGFLLYILQSLLNLFISFKFAQYIKTRNATLLSASAAARESSSREMKREQRITRMVLTFCVYYLIGNIPNSISPMLFTFGLNAFYYGIYLIFGNFMLFTSHSMSFALYFLFNKHFRKQCRALVLCGH